ncbi:MAG TPA: PAS domain S-box protein [Candidatus Sulfotelmatobacter sp.]|nr:PAS domain S-box protein [Candidatus Sulfotelmatobacter sp.]
MRATRQKSQFTVPGESFASLLANFAGSARGRDERELYRQFCESMRKWLGATGVLCATAITAEEFRVVEAEGWQADPSTDGRIMLGRIPIVREAAESLKAAWDNEVAALDFNAGDPIRAGAIVAAPLVGEKGRPGIALAFRCDPGAAFTEKQANEFAAFATLAGSLVQNATMFRWIERSKKQWIQDFDAITDFIVVHDAQNCLLRLNRALAEFLGRSPAELVGAPMSALRGLAARGDAGACPYCSGDADPSGERLLIAQGRSYLISTSQVRESAQDAGRTIHVLKDMTGQREAERRYRELFDSIQEGLFFCNLDGRILEINHALVEMLGLNRGSELRGRSLGCLVPTARRPALDSALESARVGQPIWNLELPLRRTDGGIRQYSLNLSPMRDETGKARGIVGSVADITDASVLRAKLVQAGKMAAMGQLVAGVAHEVNNPLAAILGFSQLLLENPEIPGSVREELVVIQQEAQRTKSIVENLLRFARPAPVQSEPVDVNAVVLQVLQLRGRDLGKHEVDVILHLDESLAGVAGDAQQLQQVFLNILNNAFDAVREAPRHGRILIETSQNESGVEIVFQDNGPGIADTDSVFDPFYSTKEAGEGTGLGLSICHGIVQAHGGEIFCANNADGFGCAFHVRLPLAAKPEEIAPADMDSEHSASGARN